MAERKKRREWPSDEEMQKRLDDLERLADQAIESGYGEQRKSINEKLDLISDTLQKFKGKNVPYTTIAKVIEDGVGLKVSEQTLRKYCQQKLGWPKRKNKKSESEEFNDTDSSMKNNTDSKASLSEETDFD